MTTSFDSASVYTDFQGLDQIRLSAGKNDPKALEAAAKQFEALFIQQMLKSMRDASLSEGAFDSNEGRMYLDMFDKQISLVMAQGKGMGLADMLVKQLRITSRKVEDIHKQQTDTSSTNPDAAHTLAPLPKAAAPLPAKQNASVVADVLQPNSAVETVQEKPAATTNNTDYSSPETFVQGLWPLAQQAAKQLGVEPKVLLAQAALETGWGRNINKHADGHSSYNLFNIKSDEAWSGDAVSVSTLEFHDGIAVREKARFRAYSDYGDSFNDYVQFIKSNPRYYSALQQASNPAQYTRALQQAGYATDPQYSNKIMGIVNGSPMQQALEKVKLSQGETITPKEGS